MIVAGFSLAYFGGPEWAAAYTPSPELAQVRPLTYSMTSFFRQAGYFTGGFVSAWGLLGLLGTYCDRFPKKKN